MPEPICRTCGQHFEDWGGLAQHINTSKDHKNKASKKWAKMYIHRHAINNLRKIGQNKEPEPRRALTPEQLEAKHDTKYTLSGKTEFVSVICPNSKCNNPNKLRREALELEHTRNPEALRQGIYFVKLCGWCK